LAIVPGMLGRGLEAQQWAARTTEEKIRDAFHTDGLQTRVGKPLARGRSFGEKLFVRWLESREFLKFYPIRTTLWRRRAIYVACSHPTRLSSDDGGEDLHRCALTTEKLGEVCGADQDTSRGNQVRQRLMLPAMFIIALIRRHLHPVFLPAPSMRQSPPGQPMCQEARTPQSDTSGQEVFMPACLRGVAGCVRHCST
jgi:hypothetical protein